MPSSVANVDPYLNSVQWSRRFMGLRLFLALAAAGWAGLGAHVERSVAVIGARPARRSMARGWRSPMLRSSPCSTCSAGRHGDVKALVMRVVASGRAWVAPTKFEGRDVVRICATNGETVSRTWSSWLPRSSAPVVGYFASNKRSTSASMEPIE